MNQPETVLGAETSLDYSRYWGWSRAQRLFAGFLTFIFFCLPGWISTVSADDQLQWGQRYSRNMVSSESNLPDRFDPATGENIKWVAPLGTESYATPVVAGGKVLIGTNNGRPRDPRHKGDRGVMLCLDEKDGSLCWQFVAPKLIPMLYRDWPRSGICSPATVEGDRVYTVSNRGEVVCLDLDGLADGNDGPYTNEGRYMTPQEDELLQVAQTDADIIWLFDMLAEVGVHQHDSAHSSILLHGDYLYVNTSNGLNDDHALIPATNAPSLIVLNKRTGRLVAQDDEHIGPNIFHSTWSSPALGNVDGRTLIFFCGGDGVCYAFDANQTPPSDGKLKRVWRFDCDPNAPKENVQQYVRNRKVSPSNIKSMPVFDHNRVYITYGGDIWWGKHEAWLTCIRATGSGDVTNSARVWTYPVNRHCCSTPAIFNGLVFVADCTGVIHCVDAETGKAYWTHEAKGDIWASTLVADGKIYVGTRRRDFWVLAASKEKKIISSIRLIDPIHGTATAANGVLYVATMKELYALETSAK
ncbi:MAG: PQQ-binding-like beta-propeller repeat protein [Sedimentisphaerales bacterium]|nr:PQQ-binding-like beta-propeller repeat protein [Sedimentisphaerales bacterium]